VGRLDILDETTSLNLFAEEVAWLSCAEQEYLDDRQAPQGAREKPHRNSILHTTMSNRIIIPGVNDDEDLREKFAEYLKKRGYEVVVAAASLSAYTIVRSGQHFNFIVSEVVSKILVHLSTQPPSSCRRRSPNVCRPPRTRGTRAAPACLAPSSSLPEVATLSWVCNLRLPIH
jgi:hypothetical protein